MSYSLGLDFGTNSVRALIVDCASGDEVGTGVGKYPSGTEGILLSANEPLLARQNPLDYPAALRIAIDKALKDADEHDSSFSRASIIGIGVDTTASSPIPIDSNGNPLAMQPRFADNLAAKCWLWKDHTAHAEADEINRLAKEQGRPYLEKCGGTYSSEWFWSKILRCARTDQEVFAAADSWIELQDYIPAWLTQACEPQRGICAAGHKAMYDESWGGWPAEEFLHELDPRLAKMRRKFLRAEPSSTNAGTLSQEVGLPIGIPVAIGLIDAHAGAVGSGVRPGVLVKIMGTSTCDILVGDEATPNIPGVSGVAQSSVIPGIVGIEAGQAAVGDLFQWFASQVAEKSQSDLSELAARLRPGQSGLIALDWNNGNRNPLGDSQLVGLMVGQTLHTTHAEMYRALIEATAFGSRMTMERVSHYGVPIEEVIVCGGVAEKSQLTMQTYADICNRRMKVSRSSQTCALGAAIFGAVVGGAHDSTIDAIKAMTGVREQVYEPNPKAVVVYNELYELYVDLLNAFGGQAQRTELGSLMKKLIRIRERATLPASEVP